MADRRRARTRHPASTSPQDSADDVVARAQHGDEQAFRQLYRAIQPRLLNYLRALVGEADAEDLAAETWARVARDLHTFRGDADGFRAWASTIAHHRAADHLRRRRPVLSVPNEQLPQRPAPQDTGSEVEESLTTRAALALIAQLPANQAQAILLRVIMGLDATTAAQVLGKRAGAVRTATFRGLRSLAERLEQETETETGDDIDPVHPRKFPAPVKLTVLKPAKLKPAK